MNEKIPQQPIKIEKENKKEMFRKIMMGKFNMIFNSFSSGVERIEHMIVENRELFDALENGEEIENRLRACGEIEDKGEFVKAALEVMWPIIEVEMEKSNLNNEKIVCRKQVNEMLSYDIQDGCVYVHVFSGGWKTSLKKYIDGLKELAKDIEKDESIKMVMAVSWIVIEHPRILEKIGFHIDSEITNENIKRELSFEDRKFGQAHMTREEFLNRYL